MPTSQLFSKLTPKSWIMLLGSVAVTIAFLLVVVSITSKPSYSTLLTGLNPAQTGKITAALDTKGISYQIQNGGTALAVQPAEMSSARVTLATAGLLTGAQQGMDLLNNQPLGESNYLQQITYQRALEGQLAQTIEQIQGVTSAQVELVIPQSQDLIFSDNAPSASAAVLLSGTTTLDPNAVRGIAQMVAASVQGLNVNKVTITDQNGDPLWPPSGDTAGGYTTSKQDAQQHYDSLMAAQVSAMLAQTLGPGKADVQVNADLNANQTTTDSLSYLGKPVAVQQQTQKEVLTGSGTAVGAAGAAANIPGVAQTAGGGKSNYNNTTTTASNVVGKSVSHLVVAPGAVNQQAISVLLDKSVPKAEAASLKSAVENAVDFNAKRGDTISFAQILFAKQPVAPAAPAANPMLGYAKYGVAAIGSIFFLIFVSRMVRRREREPLAGEPTWIRELEGPRSLAALERGDGADPGVRQLRSPVNVAKRQVEDLVDRDPDRVAHQVRAWMAQE